MSAEINIYIYNPAELGKPLGQYNHVTRVKANEFLFIAGMVATDVRDEIIGDGDFDAQATQTFKNIEAALRSAGAAWGNVVQFTTYLVHSQDIRSSWRSVNGNFRKCFQMENIRRIPC